MTILFKFRYYTGENFQNYDTIVREVKRNENGDFNLVWAPGKKGKESFKKFLYRMTNQENWEEAKTAQDNKNALLNGLYELYAVNEQGKQDAQAAKVYRRAMQVAIGDILGAF